VTIAPAARKGAGPRRHPSAFPLAAAGILLTGACAVGPDYSAEPRDDLAATAEVSQSAPHHAAGHHARHRHKRRSGAASDASTAPQRTASAGTSGSSGTPSGTATGISGTTAVPAPAPGWTRVGSVADPAGDLGLSGGPSYADLTSVAIDDDGSRIRFTVTVAGGLPASFPTGEVEGIGLDVYRSGGTESDYQVFLDGGSGWRAFLQTPRGFVAFPGTLRVGDRSLVLEVPWSSIGGRSAFELGTFADWSREGTLVNDSASDTAPDRGTHRVSVG
jgi:hypothetical protein